MCILSAERPYKLSRQQVQFDLGILTKRWREEPLGDLIQLKGRELAKLAELESECWEAWERSKLDAESTTTEHVTVKQGKGKAKLPAEKVSSTRKGQVGDAAFLSRILDCIGKRSALLGLDAPTKIDADVQTCGTVIELPAKELDYSRLTYRELTVLGYLTAKATGEPFGGCMETQLEPLWKWLADPMTYAQKEALLADLQEMFHGPALPDGSQSSAPGDSRCLASKLLT